MLKPLEKKNVLILPNYTNILIITEAYTFGGLETHLYGKIKQLSGLGYQVYLVTGLDFLEENLPYQFCRKIFTGFDFSGKATSKETSHSTLKLVEIIKENKIQIVDAHPFCSAIPAFFSAALTGVPFIYTMHGPASVMEGYGPLTEWFTKSILFPFASLINNVSEETYFLTKQHTSTNENRIFRNAIDTSLYHAVDKKDFEGERCCLVSRLDSVKVVGIEKFLTLAATSTISAVDIYGDGPEYNNLVQWVEINLKDSGLDVQLRGVDLELHTTYNQYSLVAGMGRVALEAASMNLPVVLVGYDGVKGLLDKVLLEKASYSNFSGRGLQNIDSFTFNQQLDNLIQNNSPYLLGDWIERNASEKIVWYTFSEQIQLLLPHSSELALDVFECFAHHISDAPFAQDGILLEKVRKILRSIKYIDSPAYKLMQNYDQQSFEQASLLAISKSEGVTKQYLSEVSIAISDTFLEQQKLILLEKDEVIRINRNEIQSLKESLRLKDNDFQRQEKFVKELEVEIKNLKAVLKEKNMLAEKQDEHVKILISQNKEIQDHLQRAQKDNNWYKATFVERSLWGVLKEKALKNAPNK